MINCYFKQICLSLFILACFNCNAQAPVSFYQDSFNGGVTCGGWSPAYDDTVATGHFYINIHPGSTIHKAYLLAARLGPAPDITVALNNLSLKFDSTTNATPIFQQTNYGGNSAVCAIDVTNLISDTENHYTLTLPYQDSTQDRYQDFYLYVAYSNPLLPIVNSAIFLNQSDIKDSMNFIPMMLTYPFANVSQFGISMFTGYACNIVGDGEYVYLNSDSLGIIGGGDINSGYCGGPIGSFYYYSDSLHGLNDDSANLYMNGSDALSNIASLLPACTTTTSLSMSFAHQGPYFTFFDNNIWGVIVTYGGPCQKITVSSDTTVCSGSTVQLKISPSNLCNTYAWAPNTGLTNNTVPNPVASPTATTTYVITDSSAVCTQSTTVTITVDTLPIVIVNPSPATVCTNQSVTLIATGAASYQWSPATWLSSTTGDTVVVNPKASITYTVTGTTDICTGQPFIESVVLTASPNKPTITQKGDTLISSATNGNQWYENDTIIIGATDSFLVINNGQKGYYYKVTVTNVANGCTITSDSLVITGIHQLPTHNNWLSIYPNPTDGLITITSSKNMDRIIITNVLGQIIQSSTAGYLGVKQTVDLSQFADGVYFVTVTSGNETATKQIAVNK